MRLLHWSWVPALLALLGGASAGWGAELIYRPEVPAEQSRTPVATAHGKPIVSLRELNEAMATAHYEAALDVHRRQLDWLRGFLHEQLIGREAFTRKVSPDELVLAETKTRPADGPRWEAARRQYADQLWREANVTITLPEPERPLLGGGGAELVYRPRTPPTLSGLSVATAGGKTLAGTAPLVNRRDFDEAMSIAYYHKAIEVHERRLQWLHSEIRERLIRLEAARRGLSADDLLRAELKGSPGTRDDWQRARGEYAERLWREAHVTVQLQEPPFPQVLASEGNTSPVIGLEDAPINIIEFCSFTSPGCRAAWKVYRQVVQQYGARVRIAHRDAPEPGNPTSMTAAVAARCAHRQKKFWPYHDLLLENQGRLGDPAALKAFARNVGLDAGAFDRCLDNGETSEEITWDMIEARRLGLSELPTLFVNSTYVPGVLPLERLSKLLDSLALP
jgi:protein-disulfide isomerase